MIDADTLSKDIRILLKDFASDLTADDRKILGFVSKGVLGADDGYGGAEPSEGVVMLRTDEKLEVGATIKSGDDTWTIVDTSETEGVFSYRLRSVMGEEVEVETDAS